MAIRGRANSFSNGRSVQLNTKGTDVHTVVAPEPNPDGIYGALCRVEVSANPAGELTVTIEVAGYPDRIEVVEADTSVYLDIWVPVGVTLRMIPSRNGTSCLGWAELVGTE